PRPPTSTLFPYTTLFRSRPELILAQLAEQVVGERCSKIASVWVIAQDGDARARVGGTQRLSGSHAGGSVAYDQITFARHAGSFTDRKSTRLNSSHVKISY